MSQSDEQASRADRELVMRWRRRAQEVRHQLSLNMTYGGVGDETQRELVSTCLSYYNALREYREEAVVENEWEGLDGEELRRLQYETRAVEEPAPGDTGNTRTSTQPAVMAVPPQRLVQMLDDLDDIARELGFSPEPKKSTPRTKITEEDIEAVKEWHSQNNH